MGGNPWDGGYGSGKTEYERYLKTEELLALQKPPDRRSHPDELLFQSIHQVEEIWMKIVVHELGAAAAALDEDQCVVAHGAITRAVALASLCEAQMRLFDLMQPAAYLQIRAGLGKGSGLDSPGFNRINEVAPQLGARFQSALERAGGDLVDIYASPSSRPEYLAVAEALVSFDAQFQRIKREHIMTVRRIIGIGTASLRGNPMEMLERSAQLTFFPMLWAVRERLFGDFKAGDLKV